MDQVAALRQLAPKPSEILIGSLLGFIAIAALLASGYWTGITTSLWSGAACAGITVVTALAITRHYGKNDLSETLCLANMIPGLCIVLWQAVVIMARFDISQGSVASSPVTTKELALLSVLCVGCMALVLAQVALAPRLIAVLKEQVA